jgi:hypothetical protein
MLRNAVDNKAFPLPRVNPHRARIDTAAVALADAEKRERAALDAFLLADAARDVVLRRMREGEEVHTSAGAYTIDRTTGRPIGDEDLSRSERRRDDAESAYRAAAQAASQARGQLHGWQKASESWENVAAYWAAQAVADASLTPQERETRTLRDAVQRALSAK